MPERSRRHLDAVRVGFEVVAAAYGKDLEHTSCNTTLLRLELYQIRALVTHSLTPEAGKRLHQGSTRGAPLGPLSATVQERVAVTCPTT